MSTPRTARARWKTAAMRKRRRRFPQPRDVTRCGHPPIR
jgi:hypothetical protein